MVSNLNKILEQKKDMLSTKRYISFERARLYTQSWMESESEPNIVRRAKALKNILLNTDINIRNGEILAGNRTVRPRSGIASPEMSPYWIKAELDTIYDRPQDKFNITKEDKQFYINDLYPYWQGKSLEDLITPRLTPDIKNAISSKIISINQTDKGQGHIIPDFEKLMKLGIPGLKKELNYYEELNKTNSFYTAAHIALDALVSYITRYISLLALKIEQENDCVKKAELCRMEKASVNILTNTPQSFYEAVQLFWYYNIALQLESNASSISSGRFDQYMYPFYIQDINRGISEEDIKNTLRQLWIKMNDVVLLRSRESAKYFAGFPTGYTIILGGITYDGRAAENKLSYLILDTFDDIKLPQPNLGVRLSEKTSREFISRTVETIKLGTGVPHIFNDEVIIPGLLARGVSLKDARNYSIVGCVEISIPGLMYGLHDIAMFNSTKLLEKVLQQYEDKINSFDFLISLLEQEIDTNVELMVKGSNIVDQAHSELAQIPLLSLLMHGCVEKGMDVTEGGCRYNFSGVQGIGFPNLVDSLEVIRQVIFNNKEMGISKLNNILKSNWEGYEALRQRFCYHYAKYGNDIDEVDYLAAHLLSKYNSECEKYQNIRGGIFSPGSYTVSANVPLGEKVGATPDGRFNGEQLADGGLSPMVGRDISGPTAVLRSVSKLDNYQTTNGSLLNIKLHPNCISGEVGTQKMVSFLLAFMRFKIQHIQFNIISKETLLDAKNNPEKHFDLVVRVAGYSAIFVDLNEKTQNDIINRTEHNL